MDKQFPLRDERAVAVKNASYKYAYLVLAFGCLIDVIVRGLAYGDNSRDLMWLLGVSGVVSIFYQRVKRVGPQLPWRVWLVAALGGMVVWILGIMAFLALKRWFWHS
jgi:hypothetical protein